MLTLRITAAGPDAPVTIAVAGDDGIAATVGVRLRFSLNERDREELRWYLEDYLQYPEDPAPRIAARIERRLQEIGERLFAALFHSTKGARGLWSQVAPRLGQTAITVLDAAGSSLAIPWELLRDPGTGTTLALNARSLVQTVPAAAAAAARPAPDARVRILLVICRPAGSGDVPFRSVANLLLKALGNDTGPFAFQVDALRPPTYQRLQQVLQEARARHRPYDIVHFDGHGIYEDLQAAILGEPPRDRRGYLVFEASDGREQYVSGADLGAALAAAGVPLLVLNACRSAHAEPAAEPDRALAGDQARAFGSLAEQVMRAGGAGVVAMRYNVYVVTAAQFMASLYGHLTRGCSLGEAVTLGRRELADHPQREFALAPAALQDWCVPVVYETEPVSPWRTAAPAAASGAAAEPREEPPAAIDIDLPPVPDGGFFGRDETLLALDRAFDSANIALLHAYAGSGKTATAAEFARWYARTGGLRAGAVIFSSLQRYLPLARLLDQVGRLFSPLLEGMGRPWAAVNDPAERRRVVVGILSKIPILWVWDNVESVNGFPAGTASAWNAGEQAELAEFLRDAAAAGCRFVLTSRRDESAWLGDLPARVPIPPMAMPERVQMLRALARLAGKPVDDGTAWLPLLRFTDGNPLALRVLAGQALGDGLQRREEVEEFVERLRHGEAAFTDEVEQGRSRSLGASLAYGFEHAFDDRQRGRLALLHLYHGVANARWFRGLGMPPHGLPEIESLTDGESKALFDRAAEIGFLSDRGGGWYAIHPALPWFLRALFDRCYDGRQSKAEYAFVETMNGLGDTFHDRFRGGDLQALKVLGLEEANLQHALRLARSHGWHNSAIGSLQGLWALYHHEGRFVEWDRLVEQVSADYVDDRGQPLPGREDTWHYIAQYRGQSAHRLQQLDDAEHWQRVQIDWLHAHTGSALHKAPADLTSDERLSLHKLMTAVDLLGNIQRDQGKGDCVPSYEEAYELAVRIGDRPGQFTAAFHLGRAFLNIEAIRSVDQAELWIERCKTIVDTTDRMGVARCFGALGMVAAFRLREGLNAKQPLKALAETMDKAVNYQLDAIRLFPPTASVELAAAHTQLGNVFSLLGGIPGLDGRRLLPMALTHFREALRHHEDIGSRPQAAEVRLQVAVALAQLNRRDDAREYARAALRDFSTLQGADARRGEQLMRELLSQLDLMDHGEIGV